MVVTSGQVRAARALLHLEQEELARRARVSVVTIRRIETPLGIRRVAAATLGCVRQVLEQAGAEFIPGGVRQRQTLRPEAEALFKELREISLLSARRLQEHEQLAEADLYDENGLPA